MKLDVRSTDVVRGDLGKIPDHDPIAEYLDYRPTRTATLITATKTNMAEAKRQPGPLTPGEARTFFVKEP